MYTKQLITILILSLPFYMSCNNSSGPENQIKDYIKQNINDPASYEPMSFSEKQTDSTKYTDDGYINMLDDSLKYWRFAQDTAINEPYDSARRFLLGETATLQRESIYMENFKSKPDGYKIMHVFRRKNKAGGVVLDSINFRFDSSMKLKDFDYKKQFNKD